MADPEFPSLTPEERETAEREANRAKELVEAALARFRHHLTDEGYDLLRAELIFQLLASPEGEAALTRILQARFVDASGEIERGAGNVTPASVSSAGPKAAGGKG